MMTAYLSDAGSAVGHELARASTTDRAECKGLFNTNIFNSRPFTSEKLVLDLGGAYERRTN